jgi:general secretion pathway protein I
VSPLARQRAFTLIEVLVALFVVALGMGALMSTMTSAADTTMRLREKSFAEWVALNRISEVRLRGTPPGIGKSSGDVDFAGEKWRWTQEVLDPGIAGIRRIDVSVARAMKDGGREPEPIAMATGFLGLAVGSPSGIEPDWSLWSMTGVAAGTGAPATPSTGAPATPAPTGQAAQ